MITIDELLGRLHKVRQTGKGRWRACCPAHGGNNPMSLAVRQGDSGHILVHCFTNECSVESIAESVGLTLDDLMQDNGEFRKTSPQRNPFNPLDVLYLMRHDLTRALVIAKDLQKGIILSPEESLELAKIIGRVSVGIRLGGGE